ncbi:CapA family protein [Mucilaginibacter segetis]|uniref:CapA family protein n=1 Tax=Mucilaginibacter segetis TaxID=2793071 RepID=A0A934PWW6_9SPHI|nr:CapA family protein [Mucilaginibacter segetis]MBK0381177.1 CapA family protein [Mucilaginibacter segetis]
MEGSFYLMKHHSICLFIAFACFTATACFDPYLKKNPSTTTKVTQHHAPSVKKNIAVQPADTMVNIAAVGDIMLGSTYPDSSQLPADSGKYSFKYADKYLQAADVTFGNLEGVLLDKGEPEQQKLHFKSKAYLFKMPEFYGDIFKKAGFNLLSMANNHSNDFALEGQKSTVKVLDSLGINYAGLKTHQSKLFTIKGVRYGFCAFSPNSQTVSLLNLKVVKSIVTNLKAKSDIVIVSFHGGGEGVDFEHVPLKEELYKGERRGNVNAFAHAAVDAGADIILGNGPHVSRAVELYKNRLIAYSLGNFCTYKSVSVLGVCGLAPLLKVKLNKRGEFINGQIVSFIQTHDKGLLPDTLNRAANRIKMLTETDFPASGLMITASGDISPVNAKLRL